jgi:hypothetical protein
MSVDNNHPDGSDDGEDVSDDDEPPRSHKVSSISFYNLSLIDEVVTESFRS